MYKRFLILLLCIFLFACGENDKQTNAPTEAGKPEKNEFINSLEEQVKKYPDSASLHLQLATALDSAGFSKEALMQTAGVLQKDSMNYGVWFMHATLLETTGDTANAIAAYHKAIKVYAAPEAMLALSNLYAEKADAHALDYAKRVLEMRLGKEADASAFFYSGVYYARKGDLPNAEKNLNESIKNNYTFMEAYIEKGTLYFDRKEYRKALEIYKFAGTVNNLYADSYYYMARCYELLGIKDSARLRFEQSLALDKNLKEAKEGLKRIQ